MKLEKWALVAEIVGAAAVVISLIYVGLGVRESANQTELNTRALQGAAYQARALAIMDRQDMLAESNNLAPILLKVQSDTGLGALDDLEMDRLNNTALGAFYRIDGMFYQYELGLFPDDYYSVFEAEMCLWVPRWRDQGLLETQQRRMAIRSSFGAEIEKFLDCKFDAGW